MISHFYFENGFLWGLIFYLLATILSKNTGFSKKYGVTGIALLYSLATIRCFVVFEPQFAITINVWEGLPSVYEWLMSEINIFGKQSAVYQILLFIWICGALLFLLRLFVSMANMHKQLKSTEVICREDYMQIYRDMFPNGKMKLRQTPILEAPAVEGIFDPVLYIPLVDYSENTFKSICLHEQYHFMHHDLTKKLIFSIIGCFLWWNPFLVVVERKMDYIFEVNCDYHILKMASYEEKEEYVKSILEVVKGALDKRKIRGAIAFSGSGSKSEVLARCKLVLEPNGSFLCLGEIVLWFLVCILSYVIVFQPAWEADMSQESGYEVTIDRNNAYLERLENGTYMLHLEGGYSIPMSEEDIQIPPLNELEIKER